MAGYVQLHLLVTHRGNVAFQQPTALVRISLSQSQTAVVTYSKGKLGQFRDMLLESLCIVYTFYS